MATLFLLIVSLNSATAQCKQENTAFKSGEYLSYNLYYNWKMVWVKAGTASYSTIQSTRNGKPAYRASLITSSNKKADQMFVLRDTVMCYSSLNLEPLYYRKGAREGDRYTVDEVTYSYSGGKTHLKQHRRHSKGNHTRQTNTTSYCVFDMINILLQARSYDFENWTKGKTKDIPIASGTALGTARISYKGKTQVKVDDGKKYNCHMVSYMEKKDGKFKELIRFYVTDDMNHVPVRIDMFLRFGSAKAYVTNMKGLRNEISSIVK